VGKAFTTRQDTARKAIVDVVNRVFTIKLREEDFDGVPVQTLVENVATQVKAADNGRPVGNKALADIRKHVSLHLNLAPDKIQAETVLAGLFEDEGRLRRVWSGIRREFGKHVPPLDVPWWANVGGAVAGAGAAVVTLFWFPYWFGAHGPKWMDAGIVKMTMAVVAAAGLGALFAVRWLLALMGGRRIPACCPAVASLVPCVVAKEALAIKSGWTRELVEARICIIVAEKGNLPLPLVARDLRQVIL
jgi:hypothetical protein